MEGATQVVSFVNLSAGLGMWAAYVVVASFLVEGVCDAFFEWRWWKATLDGKGLKLPIVFALSLLTCAKGNIDPFAMAAGNIEMAGYFGFLLSAGFVAGGSKKASMRLGNMKKALKESQATGNGR